MFDKNQPVGIFDSGIGGLTVAHAIKELLPNERLIYFGDTAHLPYGDKSEAAVQAYSVKIANVLMQKKCKVIVIACNSASSAAYELLKEYVGSRSKVINVIDPMVRLIVSNYPGKTIGLIGTKRTIGSNVYAAKLQESRADIDLKSLATPLLVPMIEEGFYNNKISKEIIETYLGNKDISGIEALILGCTHYPLIRNQINEFYKKKVGLLDSAAVVAQFLHDYLEHENLLSQNTYPQHEFLVSDYTATFEATARIFFKEKISLRKYPLWN